MALDKQVHCGIYKITNQLNGKSYIGQSIDIQKRWRKHKSKSTWNSNNNNSLYKAFRKYGLENFTFEILTECDRTELDNLEIDNIDYFNTYLNGSNRTLGENR